MLSRMLHHCPKSCGHCEKFRQPDDRKLEWIPKSKLGRPSSASEGLLVFPYWSFICLYRFDITGIGLEPLPQAIVLSWQPRAFLWPNFLKEHEIERMRYLANHKLQQSTVVTHQTQVRTSFGSDLTGLTSHDPVVAAIEARISRTSELS